MTGSANEGTEMTDVGTSYCLQCGTRLNRLKIDGKKRSVCPTCGWINYENPLPSVAALVRNQANELLLVKRGVPPGIGRWALPSGFMEIEESPEKACLRELTEETNLRGKIERLLGVYTQPSRIYKRVLIVAYEVQARGKLRAGSDSKDAKFFPIDDLPKIPFSSHQQIIRDVLKRT